jgi:GNAT superfamily N-acetyltransferase
MKEDRLIQINSSEIADELKTALCEFCQAAEATLPAMPAWQQHRLGYMLDGLVQEAIDPGAKVQFWEVSLDFWSKAAREIQGREAAGQSTAGEAASSLIETIHRLSPLMSQHLGPYDEVTLQEVTEDTVTGICRLSDTLTEPKKYFVAPNAYSFAQALFNKTAWYRAIYAGKAAVGFIMMAADEEKPEYFLWRFMLAEPFHGRGYGRQSIDRLVEYVRSRPGAKELLVSCGQGEGSPEGFYVKYGFIPTGEVIGGEIVLRLPLE